MEQESRYAIKREGAEFFLTYKELEEATHVYLLDMAKAIVEAVAPELPAEDKLLVATKGTARFIENLPQAICYDLEIPE